MFENNFMKQINEYATFKIFWSSPSSSSRGEFIRPCRKDYLGIAGSETSETQCGVLNPMRVLGT